jgi:poly-gamma-glutamate capsule biosynthesis protein CapA/YwtB (metallophosphatase superfamily)
MNTDKSSVTLIGVGDVMIAKHDATLLDRAAPVLHSADVVFGNCEWPYSEERGDTHPVEAHLNDDVEGEDLFIPGDPQSLRMVGSQGFNVMSFANNHCLHAGYRAFLRTMAIMRESDIAPVGAGENIEAALRPVIIERKGTKIAFVAASSALLPGTHAGRRTPGIVPLRRHSYFQNPEWNAWGLIPQVRTLVDRDDLAAICASVRRAKEVADVVVFSCHWGLVEERVAIADYQREAAHVLIDNGVDLILGHGTLLTRGVEVYKGKAIFYSLGKFLMKGPRPTGEVPIGVTTAVGNDSRKGMAAFVTIAGGKIERVALRPTFADEASRPQFLSADHEHFNTIAQEIQSISAAAKLNPTMRVEGDYVVVA